MLWKVCNILTYLYKYSDEINRFCSINGLFLMILTAFYQKFSPKMQDLVHQAQKTGFYLSPVLNLRLKLFTKLHDSGCRNAKFSSFWGGCLCAQARNWHCRATKSPPCRRQIYAPADNGAPFSRVFYVMCLMIMLSAPLHSSWIKLLCTEVAHVDNSLWSWPCRIAFAFGDSSYGIFIQHFC